MTAADPAPSITLNANSDRVFAASLKTLLLSALAEDGPVRIDASEVQALSTPAVQLLLAAARTAEAHGRAFIVRQPSDAFVCAFDDLGLFPEIRDWSFEE